MKIAPRPAAAGATRALGCGGLRGLVSRHCEERKRRSNPYFHRGHGLLRGACHRAALRADPLARNDAREIPAVTRTPVVMGPCFRTRACTHLVRRIDSGLSGGIPQSV